MLQMRANFPQRYTFLTVYRQFFCNFCAESPFFVKNNLTLHTRKTTYIPVSPSDTPLSF